MSRLTIKQMNEKYVTYHSFAKLSVFTNFTANCYAAWSCRPKMAWHNVRSPLS